MKRLLCLLLILTLTGSLCACSFHTLDPDDGHTFYYRNAEFQYGDKNSVINSELRDISGHSGDLFYLITLYLAGPLEETLVSPFPASTRLLSVEQADSEILIVLTDSGFPMLDSEYALACVCLALTCLESAQTDQVTIQYRDRTISLNRDSIALYDITSHPQITTEVTP